MAFTVADGTGLADANAYITVQEFKDYHKDRGNTVDGGNTELQQQIVKATDYIEQRWGDLFKGRKEFRETQFLSFPRLDLFDRDGKSVLGIATKVKNACAEYALIATGGADLFFTATSSPTGQTLKRTKRVVGPITTEDEYTEGSQPDNTVNYPEGDRWLEEYVGSAGRLVRG